jgi:type I restriction-modification system DNA methylase subunit
MARPESIAKAGYYPTPPSVVERVASLIRPSSHPPRQAMRLLDPCCGTGAALRQFADATGGNTYGIEIARDRADAAQAALDHLICGSAFAVRLAHGEFGDPQGHPFSSSTAFRARDWKRGLVKRLQPWRT